MLVKNAALTHLLADLSSREAHPGTIAKEYSIDAAMPATLDLEKSVDRK